MKPSLCPYCKLPGNKRYKNYCCNVHRKLHHLKPKPLIIPCSGCGALQKRQASQLAPSGNVYCKSCKKPSGETHHKWLEGTYVQPNGYRCVLFNGSYHLEHRVVWEQFNQACLLPNSTIHHINFSKLDNRPENLLLLNSMEHGRLHRYIQHKHYNEAARILREAAARQYFYPSEIDAFIVGLYGTRVPGTFK